MFKSTIACSCLSLLETCGFTSDEYKSILHEKSVRLGEAKDIVDRVAVDYRRRELFIDELLKEYS